MNVNLCGGKFHGRVHVTQVCDDITEVRILKEGISWIEITRVYHYPLVQTKQASLATWLMYAPQSDHKCFCKADQYGNWCSDWFVTMRDQHELSNRPIRCTVRNPSVRVIDIDCWLRISDQKDLSVLIPATSGLKLLRVSSYRHRWFNFQGESPLKAFHNGDRVQVKVLGFRDTKTHKYVHGLYLLFFYFNVQSCTTSGKWEKKLSPVRQHLGCVPLG